jgi:hypothetical protein
MNALTACFKGLSPSDDDIFDLTESDADKDAAVRMVRDDPRMVSLRSRVEQGIAGVVQVWNGDGEVADVGLVLRGLRDTCALTHGTVNIELGQACHPVVVGDPCFTFAPPSVDAGLRGLRTSTVCPVDVSCLYIDITDNDDTVSVGQEIGRNTETSGRGGWGEMGGRGRCRWPASGCRWALARCPGRDDRGLLGCI